KTPAEGGVASREKMTGQARAFTKREKQTLPSSPRTTAATNVLRPPALRRIPRLDAGFAATSAALRRDHDVSLTRQPVHRDAATHRIDPAAGTILCHWP